MSYVSPPLEFPDPSDDEIARLDLQVFGVGHREASYEVRIFLNRTEVDEATPRDEAHGYAGSYYVFGHGGCVGDAMHCHVPEEPPHRYDARPQHKLTPQTRVVPITEAWRRLPPPSETPLSATITLVVVNAVEPDGERREAAADLLQFDRLAVVAYA